MKDNTLDSVKATDSAPSLARRVLFLCVWLFLISSLFFIGLKRTDWFPWVGDCYPTAKADHFLAYCHSIRYGDYEHYAYYHQSEPEAVAHAKLAEVIFLGSSNTQFAFSTSAVSDFFQQQSIAHYVLGFGHGAQSGVAKAVAKKLKLQPKLWVVNADPFFTGAMNATFERVYKAQAKSEFPTWLSGNIHGEHSRKRWLQHEQSSRCANEDADGIWCSGQADTLHRNALNGHWSVENYRTNLERPVGLDAISHLDKLNEYSNVARRFIEELDIDVSCLVITATPRTDTPENYAKKLAESMGAPFVAPTVSGLKTIDGFHLDPSSAEKWSQSFLLELKPYIKRCVDVESNQ